MFSADQYELLDFGEGRKLERFGSQLLDRPSPAAEGAVKRHVGLWKEAQSRYRRDDRQTGRWIPPDALPPTWTVQHGELTFELKPTEFGHVGLFAEQAENWDWIARRVARASRTLKVLNLFAYTGGSTLAAAAAGAEVVHVDAAKNVVAWAKRNAQHSGLADAPIRWIVEDALKFVQRELRRGNRYDAVILDPPSYGHGPDGETWKLEQHLLPLLSACGELTQSGRAFMLLTCHSPGFGPAELQASLADAVFGHCQSGAVAGPLSIRTADGRSLPSGTVARWPG